MNTAQIIVNVTYCTLVLIPAFVLTWAYKKSEPEYFSKVMYGLLFIFLGAMCIAISEQFLDFVLPYVSQPNPDIEIAKSTQNNIQIWAYTFPAASIALGVNIISSYLTND